MRARRGPLSHSPLARALGALLALSLLGGCALLRPETRPGDQGPEPAAEAPLPPPYTLRVEVADEALRTLLLEYLDLARLRRMAPQAGIDDTELTRLVAAAPAQVRELLETEGYFNAQVRLRREPGTPPQVVLQVDPGPRTRVTQLRLELEGELERARQSGDRDARRLAAQLHRRWPLPEGAPFRNADWAAAKSGALAQLRAAGYAQARLADSAAQVDAATHEARLAFTADSGALFRTGELRIEGLERQDERAVRNLAGFGPGTPATETLLLDYQERLQLAGLYERATVTLDSSAAPEAAPVVVTLRELPLQQANVALGVDANTGVRTSVEHWHRRAFGWAATARNKVEIAQLRQAWEGELASHFLPRMRRNLVSVQAERLESDVDTVRSLRLRLGRDQTTPRADRFTFVQFETSAQQPLDRSLPGEHAEALSLNHHVVLRRLNDPLLPTRGYTLSLQSGVGQARSTEGDSGPFGRLYGRLTLYRPLGGGWYGQGRVELGQVFVREGVLVPESQRFRAGGDESVRGYVYRSLAPTAADGSISGGKVLFTASAEVARALSARWPALWGALFVDVGQAAQRWSELSPVWGPGLGLRYRSPVGPLRLDVAYGTEARRLRLHLSVGVTF
ncbi:autotransporter assembly complex protein TamA [Azohydromonas caseinilytica]|uniref:Translocation and assembly module subunit TamA n=1 Tax=Azohydromonas caseinilytica TaxID=2728836 RepID=A0A848FE78_9BURK|nr:BamA/TamA family outer membrane protein [Azohydromonas caseinilytica]NML17734.1 BamA/TamA family outer membrane protein [Azohydromonas caseinilytica]